MPQVPYRAPLIPCLRYRDAAEAVAWLCQTFRFERHREVTNDAGVLVHAQLNWGNGLLMVGQVDPASVNRLMVQPDETPGGRGTQSVYIVTEDVEAMHERVVAAGAHVVIPLRGATGQQDFSCRDPEGHVWNFGNYDPWAA